MSPLDTPLFSVVLILFPWKPLRNHCPPIIKRKTTTPAIKIAVASGGEGRTASARQLPEVPLAADAIADTAAGQAFNILFLQMEQRAEKIAEVVQTLRKCVNVT